MMGSWAGVDIVCNDTEAHSRKQRRKEWLTATRSVPNNNLLFDFLKDRATRNPVQQELHEPGATLIEKKISEASHRAKFLTILLRGKDGTPGQGVAYKRVYYKD